MSKETTSMPGKESPGSVHVASLVPQRPSKPADVRKLAARACIALLLVFSVLLGGGSLGSAPARASSPVTLTFWNGFTGPDEPAVVALVNQFNATHPDIQVKMTIEPWDTVYEKLPLSLRVSQGPDIAGIGNNYIPQYAKAGLIQPIDSVYDSTGINPKVIPAGLLQVMRYNGQYYAAPMSFDTIMLYWNKTLFAKAGLTSAPTTWAAWQADAVKLSVHANGADQYGIALGDHDTAPNWSILIWDNGGDFVSPDQKQSVFDSPQAVAAVSQWANLIRNNRISPPGLGGADADKLFQTQKAAMEMTGPWATSGFSRSWRELRRCSNPQGARWAGYCGRRVRPRAQQILLTSCRGKGIYVLVELETGGGVLCRPCRPSTSAYRHG